MILSSFNTSHGVDMPTIAYMQKFKFYEDRISKWKIKYQHLNTKSGKKKEQTISTYERGSTMIDGRFGYYMSCFSSCEGVAGSFSCDLMGEVTFLSQCGLKPKQRLIEVSLEAVKPHSSITFEFTCKKDGTLKTEEVNNSNKNDAFDYFRRIETGCPKP